MKTVFVVIDFDRSRHLNSAHEHLVLTIKRLLDVSQQPSYLLLSPCIRALTNRDYIVVLLATENRIRFPAQTSGSGFISKQLSAGVFLNSSQ